MRIIKRSTVLRYTRMHPEAEGTQKAWLKVVRQADWQSIQDVRRDYPHADAVQVASGNTVTVFNIHGNRYRLIVSIKYRFGMVYIREFLTHREYD